MTSYSSSSNSQPSFNEVGFSITTNNTYNIDLSIFEHGPYKVLENGQLFCYGLNSWTPNSIINFQDDYWKFYAFVTGKEHAIYFNKYGNTLIVDKFWLCKRPDSITRVVKA